VNIVNPIARRELIDILKGDRSSWCLFVYILVLSGAVYGAWPKTIEFLSVADRIAREIFSYFAFFQILLVSLLAPAFSAGSFTREKEEETLELLLASPISSFSIVVGKLQSAMGFLLLVIVSSLPVAAVILPLGGVGLDELVNLYAILTVMALVSATIGLTCSSYFHRTHSALVVSYLFVLPLTGIVLGLSRGFPQRFFADGGGALPFAVVGLLAVAWMANVVSRRTCRESLDPPKPAGDEDLSEQRGLVLTPGEFPDSLFLPEKSAQGIKDHDNPVFQKEVRSELLGSGTLFMRTVIQIGVILSIFFIPSIVSGRTDHFFSFVIVVMCLVSPSLSSGMFSQERERHTLELLLTTTLTSREILRGKLKALMRYSLVFVGFFICTHMVAYAFSLRSTSAAWSSIHHVLTYLILTFSTVAVVTLMAGFFSVLTMSTFRATVATYVALLVLYVGPFILHKLLVIYTRLSESTLLWVTVTSPFGPLILDPGTGLTFGRLCLWHGTVIVSALICIGLYRYLARNLDRLLPQEERGTMG